VAAVRKETGSLIGTIDALTRPERGLRPLEWEVEPWLDSVVPDAAIVDPERPVDADALLAQLVPGRFEIVAARRAWPAVLGAIACAAVVLAVLVVLI
jgi:hypothetical protein